MKNYNKYEYLMTLRSDSLIFFYSALEPPCPDPPPPQSLSPDHPQTAQTPPAPQTITTARKQTPYLSENFWRSQIRPRNASNDAALLALTRHAGCMADCCKPILSDFGFEWECVTRKTTT